MKRSEHFTDQRVSQKKMRTTRNSLSMRGTVSLVSWVKLARFGQGWMFMICIAQFFNVSQSMRQYQMGNLEESLKRVTEAIGTKEENVQSVSKEAYGSIRPAATASAL